MVSALALSAVLAAGLARAEQAPPRELWPQATAAALSGDLEGATRKTNELIETGKAYGINTFPIYAHSAAVLAQQAADEKNVDVVNWATKAAAQLDPSSPAVAFTNADGAARRKQWPAAIPAAINGIMRVFTNYRTRTLGTSDMIVAAALAIALTAAIFAIALFIRYGRSMAHDFREILSARFRGGSVTVLAFALLFLPLFLWLGPMWLVFYWFVIFFGYASAVERIFIIVLSLLAALLPLALDRAATIASGVDSPVVMAAIATNEQSYYPEALRRMQEVVAVAPDGPGAATLHLLLGNLQLQEGNDQQAAVHYRRAAELRDSAGAHVNLGNLHFLDNDFGAAATEYRRAQALDPKMAIAFYNDSVASGEMYKFDEQGQKLGQAREADRSLVQRLAAKPPAQKIVMYRPSIGEAWAVEKQITSRPAARALFGNYAVFDPVRSALNPLTIGALLAALLAPILWLKRRRAGFAGMCIKCGRTFCHRCKSARESATYCTQCIHIYLKRDGVSLDTKRSKLEEVSDHHHGMTRRNKLFATFLPGSAQVLEGRTASGVIGMLLFLLFVSIAVLTGRLAPALGPSAETAQMLVRILAILLAVVTWFMLSMPVYKRRAVA